MQKTFVAAACLAAIALAGCSSDNIVTAHGSVWGLGGETKPDGTAAAAIGAVIGDVAAVPYINKKTGEQYTVPSLCGSQNAVDVLASVNGSAQNQALSKGTLTADVGHNLAVGETAKILALAQLQTAAGATRDVMSSWRSSPCPTK